MRAADLKCLLRALSLYSPFLVPDAVWKKLQISDSLRDTIAKCMASWLGGVSCFCPDLKSVHIENRYRHDKPRLMCLHPHGVVTTSYPLLVGLQAIRERANIPENLVMAPLMRWHPGFYVMNKLIIGMNGVSSEPAAIKKFMKEQKDFMMVTGGFHESTLSAPGTDRVYLKERKGFVKYALQNNYALQPVYVFGETDAWGNPQAFLKQRLMLNNGVFGTKQGLPAAIPIGHWAFPLVPRRVPMKIVVGPPINLPHIINPTQKEIDKAHDRYVRAVQELYYRGRKGTQAEVEKRRLEVW